MCQLTRLRLASRRCSAPTVAPRGNRVEQDYGYGGQLRATRSYTPAGSVLEATETYTRNALGQVTAVSGPHVSYSYAYDTAHRLTSVTDSRAMCSR